MKAAWARSATFDLLEINEHIAADNPAAAARVAAAIRASVATLERFPNRGRIGRIAGTRELVVPRTPYIHRVPRRS
ncbi:MAG: type II toxin-antitoxin system RelE/ParE family toxin [Bauldia sp.]